MCAKTCFCILKSLFFWVTYLFHPSKKTIKRVFKKKILPKTFFFVIFTFYFFCLVVIIMSRNPIMVTHTNVPWNDLVFLLYKPVLRKPPRKDYDVVDPEFSPAYYKLSPDAKIVALKLGYGTWRITIAIGWSIWPSSKMVFQMPQMKPIHCVIGFI